MSSEYIQALNLGTGLNTTQLVTAIVDARRSPTETAINKKISTSEVQVSALSNLKNSLTEFNTNSATYSGINGLAFSENGTSYTATITDNAIAKAVSHAIEVESLATPQTLVFDGYSTSTDDLGSGSITFDFGTWSNSSFTSNGTSKSVTIADGDEDISSVAAAINDANIGVTASVIEKQSNDYALVIRSSTGLDNAVSISVAEDDSSESLSDLSYQSYSATTEVTAASNATVSIDGLSITRTTNTITDAIDGYSLQLNSVSDDSELMATSYDTDTALLAIQAFVSQLNSIITKLDTLYDRGEDGVAVGDLAGNPLVRSIQTNVRSLISDDIDGFGDEAVTLATFGVLTNRDGSISVDADTFEAAYEDDPDSFNAILNSRVTSESSAITPTISGTSYTPGSYDFDLDSTGATIDSDSMTLSDGVYYIGSGNAYGLSVTTDSTSVSTTIHIGTSLLGQVKDYFDEMLSFGNDIDTTITQYNDQISDYQDDLDNFDRQIENLRAQYVAQFAGMDAAVASLDQTKELLNGFMDSWKASLK